MAGKVGERTTSPPSPTQNGPAPSDDERWLPSVTDRLNRPVSGGLCVVGWIVSIGLFVGLVATFAGPSTVDVGESVYSTWAIAHGQVACAYPSVAPGGEPLAAPVYPLVSGAVAAVTNDRQRHFVPFPGNVRI